MRISDWSSDVCSSDLLSPLEIMIGKIVPYISVGVIQTIIVLVAAFLLFDVPMRGSVALLSAVVALFILAVLTVGYLMSTVARTQLQAMQMAVFFFLPNLLLSGFAFPFRGLPEIGRASCRESVGQYVS